MDDPHISSRISDAQTMHAFVTAHQSSPVDWSRKYSYDTLKRSIIAGECSPLIYYIDHAVNNYATWIHLLRTAMRVDNRDAMMLLLDAIPPREDGLAQWTLFARYDRPLIFAALYAKNLSECLDMIEPHLRSDDTGTVIGIIRAILRGDVDMAYSLGNQLTSDMIAEDIRSISLATLSRLSAKNDAHVEAAFNIIYTTAKSGVLAEVCNELHLPPLMMNVITHMLRSAEWRTVLRECFDEDDQLREMVMPVIDAVRSASSFSAESDVSIHALRSSADLNASSLLIAAIKSGSRKMIDMIITEVFSPSRLYRRPNRAAQHLGDHRGNDVTLSPIRASSIERELSSGRVIAKIIVTSIRHDCMYVIDTILRILSDKASVHASAKGYVEWLTMAIAIMHRLDLSREMSERLDAMCEEIKTMSQWHLFRDQYEARFIESDALMQPSGMRSMALVDVCDDRPESETLPSQIWIIDTAMRMATSLLAFPHHAFINGWREGTIAMLDHLAIKHGETVYRNAE